MRILAKASKQSSELLSTWVLNILILTDQGLFVYVLHIYLFPSPLYYWYILLDINLFSPVTDHPSSKSVLSTVNCYLHRFWHNCCQAFLLAFFFSSSIQRVKWSLYKLFLSTLTTLTPLNLKDREAEEKILWLAGNCMNATCKLCTERESTLWWISWTNLTIVIHLWKL